MTIAPKAHLGLVAGYSSPLGPVATAELLYGLGADIREDSDRVKARVGALLQLHAGTRGGKLSLGLGGGADIGAEDFHGAAGAAVKVSFVRTWHTPPDAGTEQSYLGPEVEFSVKHVNVGLGALARLAGSGGHRVRFAWDLGLRF